MKVYQGAKDERLVSAEKKRDGVHKTYEATTVYADPDWLRYLKNIWFALLFPVGLGLLAGVVLFPLMLFNHGVPAQQTTREFLIEMGLFYGAFGFYVFVFVASWKAMKNTIEERTEIATEIKPYETRDYTRPFRDYGIRYQDNEGEWRWKLSKDPVWNEPVGEDGIPLDRPTDKHPAVLKVPVNKKLTLDDLTDPLFYEQIDGVADVLRTEKKDGWWVVYYTGEKKTIPSEVAPSDLPSPDGFHPGKIPVGLDRQGEPQFIDFKKKPGVLLAGGSGSGKSVMARYLIESFSSQGVEVRAIDPHREFGPQEKVLQDREVFKADFDDFLKAEVEELEARKKGDRELKPRLMVIDEWPALADFGDNKKHVQTIAQEGRSFRMAIMLICQNPSTQIIPSEIRDNLGWKLLGRLDNIAQAGALFPGREIKGVLGRVNDPGQFMLASDESLTILQAPYDEKYDVEKGGW